MEKLFRPYSSKSVHSHADYNLFYNYVYKFDRQPNSFESSNPLKKITIKNLEDKGANLIFKTQQEKKNHKNQNQMKTEMVFEYKDSYVEISSGFDIIHYSMADLEEYGDEFKEEIEKDADKVYVRILYQQEETLNEIKSCFEYAEEEEKKNIYLLVKSEGILTIRRFDVKLPDIDIELNYGKEMLEKSEVLLKSLDKDRSGLVLFSGKPGTGKSTFIKYLSSKIDRKIIYLPSNAAEEITSPSFLEFIVDHKNCILLLEDAEKVLMSRESTDNPAISNILNLTDGFLGDCLNIYIIATFNTSKDKIDEALLRKGRLILEHHFEALPPENCNKILEKIGSDRRTEVPMTLAEIYNEEENYLKKEQKNKIGF